MVHLFYYPETNIYKFKINVPYILVKCYKLISGKNPKNSKQRRTYKGTPRFNRFQAQVYQTWGHKCIKFGSKENLTIHHMFG